MDTMMPKMMPKMKKEDYDFKELKKEGILGLMNKADIDENIKAKIINSIMDINVDEVYNFFIQKNTMNTETINASDDNKVGFSLDLDPSIYIKIKTSDKDILNFIMNRRLDNNYEFAQSENEIEYEKNLDNMRRFIRYNSHETLGITIYDAHNDQAIVKKYKDKDGNSIPIKTGLLYKCHCGSYDLADECEILMLFNSNGTYSSSRILNIKCASCGEMSDMSKVTTVGKNMNNVKGVVSRYIFNELDEKDKITIANVEYITSFFGDKYSTKRVSNKIVFNAKTGRTYLLPKYDLSTKKRIGGIKQISYVFNSIDTFKVKLEDVIAIGTSLEKYIADNNIANKKAIIPFKAYFKEAVEKSCYFYKSTKDDAFKAIDDILEGKEISEKMYDLIDKCIYHNNRFSILIMYNQNPYIPYGIYNDLAYANKYVHYDSGETSKLPSKARNMKKIREMNLVKNFNTVFDVKTKSERKYINNAAQKLTAYGNLMSIKKVLNNTDNINKILESNIVLYKNMYISDLINNFGETAVVNAILKKDVSLSEEDRDIFTFFRSTAYDFYYDTIRNYKKIKNVFPDYKFPCKRLRLKELHDKIAKDANKIKMNEVRYTYQEELMNAFDNKSINNITFKVALSNRRLVDIGSKMGICVGGYTDRVESGSLFIVYMEKDDEYIGCLEISHDGYLHQAKAKYNRMLEDEKLKALKEYCKMTNLTVDTSDVPSQYKVTSKGEINSALGKKNIKIQSEMIVEDYNVLFSEEEYNVPCVEEI